MSQTFYEFIKFDEPDLIGVWIEDETAVLFFHRDLEQLLRTPFCREGDLYILSGFMQSMEAELLAELLTDKVRFLDRKRSEN
ncbi:MAG: hypothetical protein HY885_00240 [Deltaproteobacteria bacterium]|nr:hypothetical protein [Deltaproteobacteria bacterium]